MQPGDVESTYANIDAIKEYVGFAPKTNIKEGISNFVDWYKRYYKRINNYDSLLDLIHFFCIPCSSYSTI